MRWKWLAGLSGLVFLGGIPSAAEVNHMVRTLDVDPKAYRYW